MKLQARNQKVNQRQFFQCEFNFFKKETFRLCVRKIARLEDVFEPVNCFFNDVESFYMNFEEAKMKIVVIYITRIK